MLNFVSHYFSINHFRFFKVSSTICFGFNTFTLVIADTNSAFQKLNSENSKNQKEKNDNQEYIKETRNGM